MDDKEIEYSPFDAFKLNYKCCFLCGKLIEDDKSIEHVFPRWLQRMFRLQDQNIVLFNRTTIKYKNFTIPCCKECNNIHLSKIEKIIKESLKKGFLEFKQIPEIFIFQWMAKIYYGLFHKELSLLFDRSDETKGTIVDPDMLSHLNMMHAFLQSIIKPFDFGEFRPWSLFLVNTLTYGDERDFDYYDSYNVQTFAIRLGEVSAIICFGDNGTQKMIAEEYFKNFDGIALHPLQFVELTAKVFYQEVLNNRTPHYVFIPDVNNGKTFVHSLPLQGMSTKPIYDQWNNRDYAAVLATLMEKWGTTFDMLYKEPNLVKTFLLNEQNQIVILDIDGRVIDVRGFSEGNIVEVNE